MPTYFDPIMLEDTPLEESSIVYIVKVNAKTYGIKAISSGLDKLASDPTTHAKEYWPISSKTLLQCTHNKILFENEKLTTKSLIKDQIMEYFKCNPETTKPKKFNQSVREELSRDWEQQMLQQERNGPASNRHLFLFGRRHLGNQNSVNHHLVFVSFVIQRSEGAPLHVRIAFYEWAAREHDSRAENIEENASASPGLN